MTELNIDSIFPQSYGGNAQISDIRLLLSKLLSNEYIGKIKFIEVLDIPERDALDAVTSDICKVQDIGGGVSQTYIYDESDTWVVLVEDGGGGLPGIPLNNTTEKYIVDSLNQQDQFMVLEHLPVTANTHMFVFLNGMYLTMGTQFDYILTGQKLIFGGSPITAGDTLIIKYSYI